MLLKSKSPYSPIGIIKSMFQVEDRAELYQKDQVLRGQIVELDGRKVRIQIETPKASWIESFLFTDLVYGIQSCCIYREGQLVLDSRDTWKKK